ncbi:hypothetical protein [Halorubrum halophilum]|uniref:hypothetical protein n=1 Tax=Halorubrum halophilum TaxID=413816 RepID=UPI0012AC008F|nr:hypothetical protein [Halorubrum halophilum]
MILEKVSAMVWSFDTQIMNEYQKVGFRIILKKISWILYGGILWLFIEGYSDPLVWIVAFLLVVLAEIKFSESSLRIEARKQDLIDELRGKPVSLHQTPKSGSAKSQTMADPEWKDTLQMAVLNRCKAWRFTV